MANNRPLANPGNLKNDLGQTYTYDATGQQATASYSGYLLQQYYDCDRLRVKKTENDVSTYYLRSTVLGGQVVAEVNWFGRGLGMEPRLRLRRQSAACGAAIGIRELDARGSDHEE